MQRMPSRNEDFSPHKAVKVEQASPRVEALIHLAALFYFCSKSLYFPIL